MEMLSIYYYGMIGYPQLSRQYIEINLLLNSNTQYQLDSYLFRFCSKIYSHDNLVKKRQEVCNVLEGQYFITGYQTQKQETFNHKDPDKIHPKSQKDVVKTGAEFLAKVHVEKSTHNQIVTIVWVKFEIITLMAKMTSTDCLKWPETPQPSQANLKSAYLVTLIYPFVFNFAQTLVTLCPQLLNFISCF